MVSGYPLRIVETQALVDPRFCNAGVALDSVSVRRNAGRIDFALQATRHVAPRSRWQVARGAGDTRASANGCVRACAAVWNDKQPHAVVVRSSEHRTNARGERPVSVRCWRVERRWQTVASFDWERSCNVTSCEQCGSWKLHRDPSPVNTTGTIGSVCCLLFSELPDTDLRLHNIDRGNHSRAGIGSTALEVDLRASAIDSHRHFRLRCFRNARMTRDCGTAQSFRQRISRPLQKVVDGCFCNSVAVGPAVERRNLLLAITHAAVAVWQVILEANCFARKAAQSHRVREATSRALHLPRREMFALQLVCSTVCSESRRTKIPTPHRHCSGEVGIIDGPQNDSATNTERKRRPHLGVLSKL